MLSKVLLLASLASAVLAAPSPLEPCSGDDNDGQYASSPTLPRNGGDKELTPPNGLRLLHMALGLGIQNYTCPDPPSTTPRPTGALAVLWDVLPLYAASPSPAAFASLPGRILAAAAAAHNGSFLHHQYGQSPPQADPFPPPADLDISSVVAGDGTAPSRLSFMGHHFFDERGVPTFVIADDDDDDDRETRLSLAKDEAVEAPRGADRGPDGTGAVAWLKLRVVREEGAGEVRFVYRVMTAGGNSHGCRAAGEDSTSYAATYWFFG